MNVLKDLGRLVGRVNQIFDGAVDSDDLIQFFPSYAYPVGDVWEFEIRGWIFEEAKTGGIVDNLSEALAGAADRKSLEKMAGLTADPAEAVRYFNDRAWSFAADGQSGKTIEIDLQDLKRRVGPSDINGHFRSTLQVADDFARKLGRNIWVTFEAESEGTELPFAGKIQFFAQQGVTVISDIDDTIKNSNVPNLPDLIKRTLFQRFEAVEGMPRLFRRWRNLGAGFIYLTNSPYQLYKPLSDFFVGRFPRGCFYMKRVNVAEAVLGQGRSLGRIIRGEASHPDTAAIRGEKMKNKLDHIGPILKRFPFRKFILVGDSTEYDADVYAAAFEEFGDRIRRIYIRQVKNADGDARQRAQDCFQRMETLQPGVMKLFSDPAVLFEDAGPVFE